LELKGHSRRSSILLGERHTSVFNRCAAKSIDGLIVLAVYFLGQAFSTVLGVTLAGLIVAFQDGLGVGQSLGKRIIGLQVIDDPTGIACGFRASLVRNFPYVLAVCLAAVPMVWVLFILFGIPLLLLESYLILTLESGVRLGDVLGNTVVIEYAEEAPGIIQ
jgi:hypothetical protein